MNDEEIAARLETLCEQLNNLKGPLEWVIRCLYERTAQEEQNDGQMGLFEEDDDGIGGSREELRAVPDGATTTEPDFNRAAEELHHELAVQWARQREASRKNRKRGRRRKSRRRMR